MWEQTIQASKNSTSDDLYRFDSTHCDETFPVSPVKIREVKRWVPVPCAWTMIWWMPFGNAGHEQRWRFKADDGRGNDDGNEEMVFVGKWRDGLMVWKFGHGWNFYIKTTFRGLQWMCRCFWRYTLGWGLKFKDIKPQMPKYWVLGGRTSLPSSLVKNLLSQVVLDSRNLSSRWRVVSFSFFQTFSEFHFLIVEKHLETQKPWSTSRCFEMLCFHRSTLRISRQEPVGLNYCLLWPRWLGRFSAGSVRLPFFFQESYGSSSLASMPNSFWRFHHDGNIFVLWILLILLYALGNVHQWLQIDC